MKVFSAFEHLSPDPLPPPLDGEGVLWLGVCGYVLPPPAPPSFSFRLLAVGGSWVVGNETEGGELCREFVGLVFRARWANPHPPAPYPLLCVLPRDIGDTCPGTWVTHLDHSFSMSLHGTALSKNLARICPSWSLQMPTSWPRRPLGSLSIRPWKKTSPPAWTRLACHPSG